MPSTVLQPFLTYLRAARPDWFARVVAPSAPEMPFLTLPPPGGLALEHLVGTAGQDSLTIRLGQASRTVRRCEYASDEIFWLVAIELLDSLLAEEVVAVSYKRDGNLVAAKLVHIDDFFIQHGHPAEPTHAETRSWNRLRDASHLIKAMRDVTICNDVGSLVLRYHAPEGREQLEGAQLAASGSMAGAFFVGVNLRGADFYWQGLEGTDFTRADLREANLSGTRLQNARFCEADLRNADFGPSNLGGGTRLDGTDLRGAKLEGAQFTLARYTVRTRFPDGFDPARAGMIFVDEEVR